MAHEQHAQLLPCVATAAIESIAAHSLISTRSCFLGRITLITPVSSSQGYCSAILAAGIDMSQRLSSVASVGPPALLPVSAHRECCAAPRPLAACDQSTFLC